MSLYNKSIKSACEQAERLYNMFQEEVVSNDLSDAQDELIKDISRVYNKVLFELRDAYGVGGVLINGVFRDLTQIGNEE
jgi:hypothetical protein